MKKYNVYTLLILMNVRHDILMTIYEDYLENIFPIQINQFQVNQLTAPIR